MTKIVWDKTGERLFETGVDHGVLYVQDDSGTYPNGVPWNGLTTVTESPSGAESNKQYADNIPYLNLLSAEEFGGTIEAFYYPDDFEVCDGSASPEIGVTLGQQRRRQFGLVYRTLLGNDILGTDFGYKLHLVYNALASPSEKARATVNDSPEATGLSWEFTTTPVEVGTIGGVRYKPSATLTIDSTKVDATALTALETILFGSSGVDPRLPLPAEVIALFSGTVTVVTPTAPTFVAGTGVITIPSVTGVIYQIDGVTKTAGAQPAIAAGTTKVVRAIPASGYVFAEGSDDDWSFTRTP